ncbi:kinase-like protein [Sistotremastrum suecicum HHB10207 ss-3]|uniref:Kinase-like protein n=1 Tax=Sistotremastrum suecicum HHB10207 ss-3 TaxID=1314776 RepID=A0A166FW97_9AGAM|nr:kinase-like protein [Sistotremastrum suecicum HHB10207 ss-3]
MPSFSIPSMSFRLSTDRPKQSTQSKAGRPDSLLSQTAPSDLGDNANLEEDPQRYPHWVSSTQETLAKVAQRHVNMKSHPDFQEKVGTDIANDREEMMSNVAIRLDGLRVKDRSWSNKILGRGENPDIVFSRAKKNVDSLDREISKSQQILDEKYGKYVIEIPQGTVRYNASCDETGGFGEVRMAYFQPNRNSQESPRLLALKTPKARDKDRVSAERRFRREADIWKVLKHQNINPLFDTIQTEIVGSRMTGPVIVILSPWADVSVNGIGTASSFLQDSVNRDQTLTILSGILNGLQYMHTLSEAVYHGDLKGNNVLLFGTPKNPVAKLTDFGLSKLCSPKPNKATKVGGHIMWTAPELAVEEESADDDSAPHVERVLTPEADLWGFGMTAFELITRSSFPMRDRDRLGTSLLLLYVLGSFEDIDEEMADYLDCLPTGLRPILSQCLVADASRRPTISVLKQDWDRVVYGPDGLQSKSWDDVLSTVPQMHVIYYPPIQKGSPDQLSLWREWIRPRREVRKAKYTPGKVDHTSQ